MVPSTMANQAYSKTVSVPLPKNLTYVCPVTVHKDTSVSSPKKPSGGLDLRPNPHDWDHRTSSIPVYWTPDPTKEVPMGRLDTIQIDRYGDIATRAVMVGLTNEALARFTGKVRKHNANLGVTLASWKQTADMIGGTSKKIAGIFDRRIKEVEKMSPERRRRIRVQGTAGAFLGIEFGWIPLVQDIQAGLGTLARNPPDSQWIRSVAKATTPWKYTDRSNPNLSAWIEQEGQEYWLCTISARVRVTSQNLFLANRLGLLNLPGVAWDLIPWSFVVNMFTNMGQMVNSLTDFVGVSLDMASTTKSVFADISQRALSNVNFPTYRGNCESNQIYKKRVRTLGVPTPTFQWRVPNLNLELVAILAALPLQRINKLNSLVGYRP